MTSSSCLRSTRCFTTSSTWKSYVVRAGTTPLPVVATNRSRALTRCVCLFFIFAQGRSCTTNRECPTTEAEVYAACKCGYSSKGLKYCDLAGGDDEWSEAINKVRAICPILIRRSLRSMLKLRWTATPQRAMDPAWTTQTGWHLSAPR